MVSLSELKITPPGLYVNTGPRYFEMEYMAEPYQPIETTYVNHSLRSPYIREPDNIMEYMIMERENERSRDTMDRLSGLHHDFVRSHRMRPNAIFLNRDDHHNVRRYNDFQYNGIEETFQGLKVIPTIADRSYVGIVNLEH